MTRKTYGPAGKLNRRRLLKGAAAGGAVVATGAIGGFPTVWAQNIKDITLVVAGGSYAVIKEIGDQASKDLGFNSTMQAVTDDVQINRSITQPNTIDVNNIDGTKMAYLVGKGVLRPSRCRSTSSGPTRCRCSRRTPIPPGSRLRTRVCRRIKCMYYADADGKKLAGQADRVPDLRADDLQRRHAGHSSRPDRRPRQDHELDRPAQSRVQGQDGPGRLSRRSASWTPPWRSKRAATSSTATRAT